MNCLFGELLRRIDVIIALVHIQNLNLDISLFLYLSISMAEAFFLKKKHLNK